ncbi:MAG: hypothetical protein IPN34_02220 [Planctomycetes bacterium]|nr:hypothetical protein [Planctomycetota bacterium]
MSVVFSYACPPAHLRCRGAAETPLLAVLGLGLFCWIFLTNSLPAKRELAGRLAQIERYTAEEGQLSRLKEELAEEEGLGRAVREDAVVRRALFLIEHPTAPENAPEHLLPSFAMNLPEEPEKLVEEEPPFEVEAPFEDESFGGERIEGERAGEEQTRELPQTVPASSELPLTPRTGGEPVAATHGKRADLDRNREARSTPNGTPGARQEQGARQEHAPETEKPQKAEKTEKPKAGAPRSDPRRATPSSTPQRTSGDTPRGMAQRGTPTGQRGTVTGADKSPGTGAGKSPGKPTGRTNAGKPAPSRTTGGFEVPSFLRG